MNLWLLIIISGIVTYGIRLSFIAAHGRIEMPEWVTSALAYVPMAVLSAIILPDVMMRDGAVNLTLGNVRWIAAIVAVLVAWRTKNMWMTIGVGMVALWALQSIVA